MGDGRPLNLNLLRIFVKVYETGHVTRAAEELGMSQPAVSAGLTRLAGHYGQPLFQRTKNGIAPTRLADKLFEPIRKGMHVFETGLSVRDETVSYDQKRHFRISMPNLAEPTIFTPVLNQLWREMPGVTVEIAPFFEVDLEPELCSGALDLGYHVGEEIQDPDLLTHHLVDGRWACITRKGWADDFGPMTPEAYDRAGKVLIDRRLVPPGNALVYSNDRSNSEPPCRVHRGWSIPQIVAHSDLVALVQLPFAIFVHRRFGLDIHPPPPTARPVRLEMVWHRRADRDPMHRRLRELAMHSVNELKRRMLSGFQMDEGLFQGIWDSGPGADAAPGTVRQSPRPQD